MHILVQNLFEREAYELIIERLEQLTASTQRVWGKNECLSNAGPLQRSI